MNEVNIFTPTEQEFYNLGRTEVQFKIPLRDGLTTVTMGLLFQGEILDILEKVSKRIHPQDDITRSEFIATETLVMSISAIGTDYYDYGIDESKTQEAKTKLRAVLRESSPLIIKKLYQRYLDLESKRDELINKIFEESDDQWKTQLLEIKPL